MDAVPAAAEWHGYDVCLSVEPLNSDPDDDDDGGGGGAVAVAASECCCLRPVNIAACYCYCLYYSH